MGRRVRRVRAVTAVLVAWVSLIAGGPAWAGTEEASPLRLEAPASLGPGVTYRGLSLRGSHGPAYGHLLTVDLRDPHVSVDLLHPGAVAERARVSQLADRRGVVAAVNGDFFNITETQHPGVEATGAPVGPAIADGRALKAAVPDSQRFGPAMPRGVTTEDVLGVGTNGVGRLDRLTLEGSLRTPDGELPLNGFNQYALPMDGIGAFTPAWGRASRVRATCGTDTDRGGPCSDNTYELTVRRGRVATVAQRPGRGPIAQGSVVLVGREDGARELRKLSVGDRVTVGQHLRARRRGALSFAVGGFPVLRGGRTASGLDPVTAAVRTAAGLASHGRRLYLLALDGDPAYRSGLTVPELAWTMRAIGAVDAFNLDGGGSTTLVTRGRGGGRPIVRNHPSGGAERPVANGIGVFISP
ncbi:phosphodiester glycosidase family protein [Streptomyces triculaminicus]|uniref:Phosphodiester glycosidase family protein n=2 Tax=Streptomyces TaxID=1883 RepID=A0A939FUC9_9ACTN|nr:MULTISPECIES: phosphodiester glycosidase family protein [Streptomyces]MBO0656200.1 phosphodiester glycosidase family protein [Streptomyces triculaminicus]QSY50175.1 phosphodiester glycosidase family protein [Streptomyces griseocarneus]